MFQDNTKFNVKFEIQEHVYSTSNPNQEVNATTTPINSTTLVIKINKQILLEKTNLSKTNIEVAITTLHECIHAYLAIKANFPNSGQPIPNAVNMDLQELLNAVYANGSTQHDFIYNHMVPTMQNILSQLLNTLTTAPKSLELENNYTVHPNYITNPSISNSWNWQNYFFYLSLNGLEGSAGFQSDFPSQPLISDAYSLFTQYVTYGHTVLDYILIP